jgi:adenine-specific DNA-methyltransferase
MTKNFNEKLIEVLKKDLRFVDEEDNSLLRNEIINSALRIDKDLIGLLIKDKEIREAFFDKIEEYYVFNINKFMDYVQDKNFLSNSYTQFKNKIGLNIDGKYLGERGEVSLVWAFKDCVLEGGMTKEDQKGRREIFFNQTLAKDEIDRLLDLKVLINFKKYSKKGDEKIKEFNRDGKGTIKDNLVIKGNNLLALHSLKKEFKGKIKLIYIDPPYNTGSDSFRYNDNFNHSTWLTFMKNRLEVARELLGEDGAIFVQVDHHEIGYINILLDEIFSPENKVQVISAKTASPAGFKTVNPGPIDVTEYILFYTKSKRNFPFKKQYVPVEYNKNYNLYIERSKDIKNWKFVPISEKVLEIAGFKSESEAKKKYGDLWKKIKETLIAEFAFENADNVVSIRDPHNPTAKIKELMDKSRSNGEKIIEQEREDGSKLYLYKGGSLAFYSNKIRIIDGKKEVTELLTDFWNHISWAGIAREGGITLKNAKKPEKLLKQIIEIATEEGDIVLDYHLGSGTTCAVAHKMGRQYIGIEQMDYGENDSIIRLQNVIKGDQSGISNAVNWKGGGEFIYFELMKYNEEAVEKIEKAKDTKDLVKIWGEMCEKYFLNYDVDIKKFNESKDNFEKLNIHEQKRLLLEMLNKNQLYVNLSEIEDSQFKVSKEDKELNKKFYGGN